MSEVVTVSGDSEKQIDLRSTTVAHNVTAEEFDRMPKARSFQSIALTSPGVNQGDVEGGFQVNGASGAENSFTVDGVNTNSLLYGSSRQDTQFEYLQEVQVKTGGIAAEYGGALGGVISAVTKSGGNRFTGEGHYYYSGNSISANSVQRLQLSPLDDTTVLNVQDAKQKNNRSEVGGSIGGPIMKDHLFFFGSVSPRFIRRTNDYLFSNGTEPGSHSAVADRDPDLWQGDRLDRRVSRRTSASSTRRCVRPARSRPTTAPARTSSAARWRVMRRRSPAASTRIRPTSAATST